MSLELGQYGKTLGALLKRHNLSVSALQTLMRLSSRTTIARVLKDESKYSTVLEFHSSLKRLQSELPLTEEDWSQLDQSLEISRCGLARYLANKRMTDLLRGNYAHFAVDASRCKIAAGENRCAGQTLTQVLLSTLSWPSVKLRIVNAVNDFVGSAVRALLHAAGLRQNIQVDVEQFVLTELNDDKNILNFTTLYPLLEDPRYRCYTSAKTLATYTSGDFTGQFYATENYMIILKTDGVNFAADRLNFYTATCFSGIFDTVETKLYQYELTHFNYLREHYTLFASPVQKGNDPQTLLSLSSSFAETERNWQNIFLKPNLSAAQVEPEILLDMARDADCWGLTENHPLIQSLWKIQRQRYEYYTSPKHHTVAIFSRAGMRSLLETRRWADQPAALRPMTRQELKRTLKTLVRLAENNSGFCVYLLKDGQVDLADRYFKVCGDDALWLGNSAPGDGSLRLIRKESIVGLFRDYVLGELLPRSAYSRQETVEFLKRMLGAV